MTAEFMERLLPPSGTACVSSTGDNGRLNQTSFIPVGEAWETARVLFRNGTTSISAASFRTDADRRTKLNATGARSWCLDVEVDPDDRTKYPSVREAAEAVLAYAKSAGRPTPSLVFSGRGIHAWWHAEETLDRGRWLSVAQRILAGALQAGVKLDRAVTCNIVQPVRIPGSPNPKGSVSRLLHLGKAVPVAHIEAGLPEGPDARPAKEKDGARPPRPPADFRKLVEKCQQVRRMVAERLTLAEPERYRLLGAVEYCDDADLWSARIVHGHPTCTAEEAREKRAQWRRKASGPTSCAQLAQVRPDGCAGCPVQGLAISPLDVAPLLEPVPEPEDREDLGSDDAPEPFRVAANGVWVDVGEGVMEPICPYPVRMLSYGEQDGSYALQMIWLSPKDGWRPISIPFAALNATRPEFGRILGDAGLTLSDSKKDIERIQTMLTRWAQKVMADEGQTPVIDRFGWTADHTSFTLGRTTYARGGHSPAALGPQADALADAFIPAGDEEEWHKALAAVEGVEGMWPTLLGVLLALSAPLWAVAGTLRGAACSFSHQDTGTGKTLALRAASSVYGMPEDSWISPESSLVAIGRMLSLHHSVPACVDEVSDMKPELIRDMLHLASRGQDKSRVTQGGKMMEGGSWQTLLLMSGNHNIRGKLAASKVTTTAHLQRVLEIRVERPEDPLFPLVAADAANAFAEHHGHAGVKWIRRICSWDIDSIRTALAAWATRFDETVPVGWKGEERYWRQILTLAWTAGTLARDAGIIRFDPTPVVAAAARCIDSMRLNADQLVLDPYEQLAAYLQAHARNLIVLHYDTLAKKFIPLPEMERRTQGLCARLEVIVRKERKRDEDGKPITSEYLESATLSISRNHARTWWDARGYDFDAALRFFSAEGLRTGTRGDTRMSLGKGVPWEPSGQVRVFRLDLMRSKALSDMVELPHYEAPPEEKEKVVPIRRGGQ